MTDNQGSIPQTTPVTVTQESTITNPKRQFQSRKQANEQILAKVAAEIGEETQTPSSTKQVVGDTIVKEPTVAEQRKEFLVAQKAIRKAQEEQKKAKEAQNKAEQEASKYKADWKTSPTKYMEQIGLNPDEVYKAWTNEYLGIGAPSIDPIEEKIKAAVSPYIQQLEEEKAHRVEAQNRANTESVISTNILPLLSTQEAKEDYGTLFVRFNQDPKKLSEYVYQQVMQHWNSTGGEDGGEIIPFAEALKQLEDSEVKMISYALNNIKDMKKYSKYFGSHEDSSTGTIKAIQEQPTAPTRTLTNALKSDSIRTSTTAGTKKHTVLTSPGNSVERRARIDEVLAEFEDK